MQRGRYDIRRASEDDVDALASIHVAAYSRNHFTSRLSRTTLKDYYRLFLGNRSEILVLSEDGGPVLGFAVFGHNIGERIKYFKSKHVLDIIRASLRHPKAAGEKALRMMRNKVGRRRPMTPADCLILSIAVLNPGKGAGGCLLDGAIERCRKSGSTKIGLYVNVDNLAAINSYSAKGFSVRELYGGQFYMERSL